MFLPMVARIVYTQTRLRANAFTHKLFYARTLLHTTLLHTNTFTHRRFYTDPFTQTLLHTDAFTQTLLHTNTFTQILHTDAFTHRPLRPQPPSHTNTFAHRPFWPQTNVFFTKTLLHTNASTHKHFYTQGEHYRRTNQSRKNHQFLTLERVAAEDVKSQKNIRF